MFIHSYLQFAIMAHLHAASILHEETKTKLVPFGDADIRQMMIAIAVKEHELRMVDVDRARSEVIIRELIANRTGEILNAVRAIDSICQLRFDAIAFDPKSLMHRFYEEHSEALLLHCGLHMISCECQWPVVKAPDNEWTPLSSLDSSIFYNGMRIDLRQRICNAASLTGCTLVGDSILSAVTRPKGPDRTPVGICR